MGVYDKNGHSVWGRRPDDIVTEWEEKPEPEGELPEPLDDKERDE